MCCSNERNRWTLGPRCVGTCRWPYKSAATCVPPRQLYHLYGVSREDASYVLDTFPIVRKQDEAAFGRYRTRDLIPAYMNALAAGDTETMVAV